MPSIKILSAEQKSAIEFCARTMSVLSLVGSCFIISTFISYAPFRKPINRLVFYATWGNIMANVATLISTSAIPSGPYITAFCEFQGVLIQWFMMADSLWVFCMATNVFLVFWYGYDARQLRHLEKWYFLFAYGVPAIPPMTYAILDHTRSTRIIGPATLWCWVAKDVEWMRIAFFYGPVWIAVIATLVIYAMTGFKIYRKRALLRPFLRQAQQHSIISDSTADETVHDVSVPTAEGIMVTHEVQHEIHQQHRHSRPVSDDGDDGSFSTFSSTQNLSSNAQLHQESQRRSFQAIRTSYTPRDLEVPMITRNSRMLPETDGKNAVRTTVIANSFLRDSSTLLPPRPTSAATHHNAAALAYLKVAFLMFAALFVVWIPSTVNRLYQFIHKDQPSYALNIISAIVLPLQGAWNATIYIYTTKAECHKAYQSIKARITGSPTRCVSHEFQRRDDSIVHRRSFEPDLETQYAEPQRKTGPSQHIEMQETKLRYGNRTDPRRGT